MLFHHESPSEQINLDKEPLLSDFKCKQSATNQQPEKKEYQILNDISIYIDEYYLTKFEINMSSTSKDFNDFNNNTAMDFNYESYIGQNLLGIFVVSFDTKQGNLIEWQIPDKSILNLDKIEFKAMASGFHLVQNDFVYFCKNSSVYGLAAFESIRIENSEERNVRMKSVGIVAKSYKFLKDYVVFLKNQVSKQLEEPGNYDSLISLWRKKRVLNLEELNERSYEQRAAFIPSEHSLIDKLFNKRLVIYKQINSINLVDYCPYTKFSLYFGPVIFALWKYVLLNKRIMFYSTPPISDLCSRVLCASQMINTTFESITKKQQLKPIFYVNVIDIEQLQEQPFYLACTTEKIFESKYHLYDLFVNETQLNAALSDCQKIC